MFVPLISPPVLKPLSVLTMIHTHTLANMDFVSDTVQKIALVGFLPTNWLWWLLKGRTWGVTLIIILTAVCQDYCVCVSCTRLPLSPLSTVCSPICCPEKVLYWIKNVFDSLLGLSCENKYSITVLWLCLWCSALCISTWTESNQNDTLRIIHPKSATPTTHEMFLIPVSWLCLRWTMLETCSRRQLLCYQRERCLTSGWRTAWSPTATGRSASTVRETIKATGECTIRQDFSLKP